MTPAEKVGLWCLRFFCFFVIFFGCLLTESDRDSLMYERFNLNVGYISENRWNDLVVAACVFISVLITLLIVLVVSGKSEAVRWFGQICVFLALFAGVFAALPERLVSFVPIMGGSLALTSLLIFVIAKRKDNSGEDS